ncbi:hypothetical protein BDR03DRAFT_985434 [Suillus americanus]|nr:hypothetical protein BDR03DRAFT_985434 [Suillus americanus]
MATSGRKKTRSTNRGWWWEEFTSTLAMRAPNLQQWCSRRLKLAMNVRIMYEMSMQLREQLHAESVWSHARGDLVAEGSRLNQVMQPIVVHAMLSAPQLYSDSSQIAGPSSAIDLTYPPSSTSPDLGLFIPGLLADWEAGLAWVTPLQKKNLVVQSEHCNVMAGLARIAIICLVL